VMVSKNLIKQQISNNPVKQPHIITKTTTIGVTKIKKSLLSLSKQRKSRKQGRLKNDVHWVWHMYSENWFIKFTSAFT